MPTRSPETLARSYSGRHRRPSSRGQAQPPAHQARCSGRRVPRRTGRCPAAARLAECRKPPGVCADAGRRAESRGRTPARSRAVVRAPRGLVDGRRAGARPPEGAACPLPNGLRAGAGIRAPLAPPARRRAFPGARGAVTGAGPGPDPDAFAALLCDWCLEVVPDDRVLVSSTTLAEPLALALHNAILQRDAWP